MSQLAKKLIEKEKREKTGSLDLGYCGLTDLDEQVPELFELVWLERLVLSNEYWDYDNKYWKKSNNNFSCNNIIKISSSFVKLSNLKHLYIGGSATNVDFWRIKKIKNLPENLTRLYLSCNQIFKSGHVLKNKKKSLT